MPEEPTMVSGVCRAQVYWNQWASDRYNPVSQVHETIWEDVLMQIFDGNATKIGNPEDERWMRCSGTQGDECRFRSLLPHYIIVSPQQNKDYMHFYYGDQNWYTTAKENLKERERYYLENPQERPNCDVTVWRDQPRDSEGAYLPPWNEAKVQWARTREIKCLFECEAGPPAVLPAT